MMIKKNSLSAYFDPKNKRMFNGLKSQILRELRKKPNQSKYQLMSELFCRDDKIQKRLTDLFNDGIIEVTGEVEVNGNMVSCYSICEQQSMFASKPRTLAKWLKDEHPEILHKYEILEKHAI